MRLRRLAATLAVPALLLSACGGGETATVDDAPGTTGGDAVEAEGVDGMNPQAMLAAAASKAEAAGSARVEMTMSFSGAGQSGSMTMTGEQDLATGKARMVMDMSDLLAQMGGQVPDGIDPTMEVIMDGTRMYMRGGTFEMIGIDGWIFMDLEATAEMAGVDLASMMGTQPQDFGAYLDMLKGASQDITEVGREDVRGVATTHFSATVDQGLMYAELDAEARADLEALMAQSGFPETYPMDVWVDDDGLVRRISMEMSGLEGELSEMSIQMEFFDFGAEVDVTPPADAVDFMELMQGGFGG